MRLSPRSISITAAEIARRVSGALHGPDRPLRGVAPLSVAGPDDLAFTLGVPPEDCAAGVLLAADPHSDHSVVVVPDPKAAFVQVLAALFPEIHPGGVQPGAFVHSSAEIAPDAVVHPGAYIGADCRVGPRAVIFPNAVLYPGTGGGADCRGHAGAVLGADGFSYHPTRTGPLKVPQIGTVQIDDRVEIGANTCVDRAFLDTTVVGADSKIDNLVQIGHNNTLGRAVIIAAQTGLSGSVDVGDAVAMGGQVGVSDHTRIGRGARLGARTGVHRDVPPGQTMLGAPAQPIREALRMWAVLRRLPDLWRRLLKAEARVAELEARLEALESLR